MSNLSAVTNLDLNILPRVRNFGIEGYSPVKVVFFPGSHQVPTLPLDQCQHYIDKNAHVRALVDLRRLTEAGFVVDETLDDRLWGVHPESRNFVLRSVQGPRKERDSNDRQRLLKEFGEGAYTRLAELASRSHSE